MKDENILLDRALAHHRAGKFRDAADGYKKVLRRNPRQADALYLFGCLIRQSGNHSAACELFGKAADIAPEQAQYHNALGLALIDLARYADAERSLRQAITLSNQAEFHNSLGTLFKRQGRFSEAIDAYNNALLEDDSSADVHYNLGNAQRANGDLEQALESFRRAIELDLQHGHALAAMGQTLNALNRPAEALAFFKHASEVTPDDAELFYETGCAYNSLQNYVPAIDAFQTALRLRPNWLEARHNLARALYEMGQVSAAFNHFKECDHEQARAMMAVIVPGVPEADNAAILEVRKSWAVENVSIRPQIARHFPLRIGYVSSFFHRDNWMKPVWGLINRHDRREVQVHLFSDAPAASIEHGYRAHPEDSFFDTTALSNEGIAELVRQCGIDVVIDLNGYSNVRRLRLFALGPAPVVVGWFNWYATTGLSSFDYLVGDQHVIPADEEPSYCERVLRVSGSYLTFEVNYPVPPVTEPPCLADGRITFGSLASQYKITNEVIDVWSRILQGSPGSSLLLKNKQLAASSACEFMLGQFAARGIGSNRIELERPSEHFEFLRAYDRIDIALDTFPYNGGTTTTEAIWQGVPVITFRGDRWASRTSTSILRSGGLGEFVASDAEGYITMATELANSSETPKRLAQLRREMRSRLSASKICDTAGFAREMEAFYRSVCGV